MKHFISRINGQRFYKVSKVLCGTVEVNNASCSLFSPELSPPHLVITFSSSPGESFSTALNTSIIMMTSLCQAATSSHLGKGVLTPEGKT
ncbi:hypothetical protein XENTR_v10019122 [Xenopus tropicalis]|nr:hypothetical protein XENTR_v10019122 [Xenopus tropicalis]